MGEFNEISQKTRRDDSARSRSAFNFLKRNEALSEVVFIDRADQDSDEPNGDGKSSRGTAEGAF
jgi:hypothetical protein